MSLKDILAVALYYIGRRFYTKRRNVLSLYFHNPTYESFERIVLWLQRQNYSFISSDTLIAYVKGEILLNEKSVFISFDDGWQTNVSLVPLIEQYQIPITVFIATEPTESGNFWWEYARFIGGINKVNELKHLQEHDFLEELSSIRAEVQLDRSAMTINDLQVLLSHPLIEIQSHTHTHPILTNLTEQSLDDELKYSKFVLESITKKSVDKFSYPNGSFSDREKSYVEKYYKSAFSTIQGYPTRGGDLYAIPRIALTDEYWPNLAKIVGAWYFLRTIFKRDS